MLQEYLEAVSRFQPAGVQTFERLLLERGEAFPSPPRARPKGLRRMRAKECFRNAHVVAEARGWRYVEGYAYPRGLVPVHHAWCLTPDRVVIEPTWPEAAEESIGIPMRPEAAWRVLAEKRTWGIWPEIPEPRLVALALEAFNGGKP